MQRLRRLAAAMCRHQSAKEAAEELRISYQTAKSAFDRMRRLMLQRLELDYEAARDRIEEYEESLYLDHNKRRDKRHIFDAHNYLIFDYGERVYTILMPSLSRYKQAFVADGLEEQYWKEFSRFLTRHRIAKLQKRDNTIERFRRYLDTYMKPYRGVDREQFIYYLKAAEFCFNYQERCEEVLWELILAEKF